MGREHHGTNCAYRANPDEPCTCGVTERTEREMHAAWRKRAEEAETALAAMTKERDDQAEAVRKLARVAAWMKLNMADPRIASACLRRHVDGVEKLVPLVEAFNTDWLDAMNNPIARAAVEGER